MMASKARLFGSDSALSPILATDDLREQKCLGRQIRHFDHEPWQQECENIGLQGNLSTFSQNDEMRLALMHTGQRRLAEASPHDKLWGIGLSACDYRASSPNTWRGSNLLGQALEHVRETLRSETMPQKLGFLPTDTTGPMDHPGDTVFGVDSITRIRLHTAPVTEPPHNAILSALMDSIPDGHAPEVLLANTTPTDKSFISEHGPNSISGVVTMDDATFTTLPSLTSGALATSQFPCHALLDTRSPQSYIHQDAFEQMVATGAAVESYVRSTTPRSWSGFGSQELLSTNRQARMTIQFYHNDTPSASLAVWIYIVPNETMRCPLLLGPYSWMRFHSRSYQTLAPTPDGRLFGELALSHIFGDAAAYVHSRKATDTAYHLVYDGPGMSLNVTPQLPPVHLICLDGSPAVTGHYMVDMVTTRDGQDPSEHFVGSGRQTIPLTGYRDLEPGDILGTASAPLLRVPLEALAQHDAQIDVTTVAESLLPSMSLSEATNVPPDPSYEPPSELLHRLDDDQRVAFLRLWSTAPPHIRRINFALDAPGWEPSAIDALSATLAEYADIFSSSKLDYGAISLRPLEIKVTASPM